MEQITTELKTDILHCKECFHFKTIDITTANLFYLKFENNKILQKKLTQSKYGEFPIYYCKLKKLPSPFYFNADYANCLNCEFRDV